VDPGSRSSFIAAQGLFVQATSPHDSS
jgi:hypothetical protein